MDKIVDYLFHIHHDAKSQSSFSCMVAKPFHGRLRARKLEYDVLNYAAKQSIKRNLKKRYFYTMGAFKAIFRLRLMDSLRAQAIGFAVTVGASYSSLRARNRP